MHVEPAPLNSYIPKKPLGRPSTSLVGLANSVKRLSEGTPLNSSTPNGIKPQVCLRYVFFSKALEHQFHSIELELKSFMSLGRWG